MKTRTFTVVVHTPAQMTEAEARRLLDKLIQFGMADAQETVINNSNNEEGDPDAFDVVQLEVESAL